MNLGSNLLGRTPRIATTIAVAPPHSQKFETSLRSSCGLFTCCPASRVTLTHTAESSCSFGSACLSRKRQTKTQYPNGMSS